MSASYHDIRLEIEDIHRVYVDWFHGLLSRDDFDAKILPAFDESMWFCTPDGQVIDRASLIAGLHQFKGLNPRFRILIQNVEIMHESKDTVFVTYTEWQRDAYHLKLPDNGRIVSALLCKGRPFRWRHVHETWLPEITQKHFPKF